MATATELREQAAILRERARESFERCDTDGFLSQWASRLSSDKLLQQADILENGGKDSFTGLYEGSRRVKARIISTKYGICWLLHDDEQELIARRGKKFLPCGKRSRILKSLGLQECEEQDYAEAVIGGSGTGLSGAATAHVTVVRDVAKSDRWGGTAART